MGGQDGEFKASCKDSFDYLDSNGDGSLDYETEFKAKIQAYLASEPDDVKAEKLKIIEDAHNKSNAPKVYDIALYMTFCQANEEAFKVIKDAKKAGLKTLEEPEMIAKAKEKAAKEAQKRADAQQAALTEAQSELEAAEAQAEAEAEAEAEA